jgi:hypothetical protein
MKKVFNLSVVLAVLFAAFTFTSCDNDDDDAASITIALNQSGIFTSGDLIAGTITSPDEDLTKVTIMKEGSAVKTYTSFNSLPIQKGNNGVYAISISDVTATGEYKMIAESKTGREERSFTIQPNIDWASGTNTISQNGTYYYKQGTTTGTLVVSVLTTASVAVSLDGKATVTLSDTGNSYLKKDGTSSAQSGVNAANFLLAKRNGQAQIVDKDGLTTPIAGAEAVVFVRQ